MSGFQTRFSLQWTKRKLAGKIPLVMKNENCLTHQLTSLISHCAKPAMHRSTRAPRSPKPVEKINGDTRKGRRSTQTHLSDWRIGDITREDQDIKCCGCPADNHPVPASQDNQSQSKNNLNNPRYYHHQIAVDRQPGRDLSQELLSQPTQMAKARQNQKASE